MFIAPMLYILSVTMHGVPVATYEPTTLMQCRINAQNEWALFYTTNDNRERRALVTLCASETDKTDRRYIKCLEKNGKLNGCTVSWDSNNL